MKISIPPQERRTEFDRLYADDHDSAYSRAIGMELTECQRGKVHSRIALSAFNQSSDSEVDIDPFAAIGLVDHAAASAIYTQLPEHLGCSTFDLRFDFTGIPTGREIFAATTVIDTQPQRAIVRGEVRNHHQQLVAVATGLFRIGNYPGAKSDQDIPPLDYSPGNNRADLCQTLGIIKHQNRCELRADNPAVIGWRPSWVLHGGAIAHLSAVSAAAFMQQHRPQQRLRSMHTSFIRPGKGGQSVHTENHALRLGKSGSTVRTQAIQANESLISESTFTFSL